MQTRRCWGFWHLFVRPLDAAILKFDAQLGLLFGPRRFVVAASKASEPQFADVAFTAGHFHYGHVYLVPWMPGSAAIGERAPSRHGPEDRARPGKPCAPSLTAPHVIDESPLDLGGGHEPEVAADLDVWTRPDSGTACNLAGGELPRENAWQV